MLIPKNWIYGHNLKRNNTEKFGNKLDHFQVTLYMNKRIINWLECLVIEVITKTISQHEISHNVMSNSNKKTCLWGGEISLIFIFSYYRPINISSLLYIQ